MFLEEEFFEVEWTIACFNNAKVDFQILNWRLMILDESSTP
jgi:hypothetical protein